MACLTAYNGTLDDNHLDTVPGHRPWQLDRVD
jgi:hypothetical protein